MAKLFEVNILNPEKVIYKGQIISLVVPAEFGYLGVLADHAPLIANLVPGKITIREGSDKVINIDSGSNGFLEIQENKVSLLLDS